MELVRLLEELTLAARKVGIEVRTERFDAAFPDGRSARGGLCTLRGRRVIVVDQSAPLPDRIAIVAGALGRIDLEGVYLAPIVRATIGTHTRSAPAPAPAPAKAPATPRPLARARKREA